MNVKVNILRQKSNQIKTDIENHLSFKPTDGSAKKMIEQVTKGLQFEVELRVHTAGKVDKKNADKIKQNISSINQNTKQLRENAILHFMQLYQTTKILNDAPDDLLNSIISETEKEFHETFYKDKDAVFDEKIAELIISNVSVVNCLRAFEMMNQMTFDNASFEIDF